MDQKIKQVFDLIKRNKADSLISVATVNRKWLIKNNVADFALVLYKDNKVHVFVDERDIANLRKNNPNIETHLYKDASSWLNFCKAQNIKKTLFESNFITFDEYNTFVKPLRTKLIPIDANDLRLVKTTDEIEKMQKAADIICAAIEHLRKWAKIGVSEIEVAKELYHFVMKKGATGLSFPTIVGFGENAADIHGVPSNRKLKKNEIILVDAGCVYEEYCSDITRVWSIGKLPTRMQEMYQVVLNANKEGIKKAKANILGTELDAACRNYIKKHWDGYDIPHGIGHGAGLLIHENPRVNKIYNKRLQSNSIITIEPGIYDSSIGGVRVEDTVLLTETGCRVLTNKSPK